MSYNLLLCHRCAAGISLIGDNLSVLEGVELRCPSCGSHNMQRHLQEDVDPTILSRSSIRSHTPEEALMALEGIGYPDEQQCDADTVRRLLGTSGVLVSVKDVAGTSRSVVDFLELPSGTRIYLGSSAHGAIAYRVTNRKRPSDVWPFGDMP